MRNRRREIKYWIRNRIGNFLKKRGYIIKSIKRGIPDYFEEETEKIISRVDSNSFQKIKEKYKNSSEVAGFSKYLDWKYWMIEKVKLIHLLELHRNKKKLEILDLGTGTGYFPLACKYYGHEAEALDLGDNEMYNSLLRLFKINRKEARICRYKKLPKFDKKFDLVTAFMVCFNEDKKGLWSEKEWEFFLNNLNENVLKKEGSFVMLLNNYGDIEPYSPDLKKYFEKRGAKIFKNWLFFKKII